LCPQPAPAPRAAAPGLPGRARPPAHPPSRLGCAGDAPPPALRLLAAGRGAMDVGMKKFTVRRFFSVYLRKKSRSKSSSLGRLEVNAGPGPPPRPDPSPVVPWPVTPDPRVGREVARKLVQCS
jgi:hypothetical protein